MALKDQKHIAENLIYQLQTNINFMQNGKLTLANYSSNDSAIADYANAVSSHTKQINNINENIKSISDKYLYNLGEHITSEQYNRTVSNLIEGAKVVGKGAIKVGSTILETGKEITKLLIENADKFV